MFNLNLEHAQAFSKENSSGLSLDFLIRLVQPVGMNDINIGRERIQVINELVKQNLDQFFTAGSYEEFQTACDQYQMPMYKLMNIFNFLACAELTYSSKFHYLDELDHSFEVFLRICRHKLQSTTQFDDIRSLSNLSAIIQRCNYFDPNITTLVVEKLLSLEYTPDPGF